MHFFASVLNENLRYPVLIALIIKLFYFDVKVTQQNLRNKADKPFQARFL